MNEPTTILSQATLPPHIDLEAERRAVRDIFRPMCGGDSPIDMPDDATLDAIVVCRLDLLSEVHRLSTAVVSLDAHLEHANRRHREQVDRERARRGEAERKRLHAEAEETRHRAADIANRLLVRDKRREDSARAGVVIGGALVRKVEPDAGHDTEARRES